MLTRELTYHGLSCFSIEGAGKTIRLDRFLKNKPLADTQVDDVQEADYILIPHALGHHLGDVIRIAQHTGAIIISSHTLATNCPDSGIEDDRKRESH